MMARKVTRTNWCLAVLLAIGLGGSGARADQVIINRPAEDPVQFPGVFGPRQFKTGTGRIRGRVLSLEGAPLRRAQVRIGGPEVPPKAALTDANGRYEFRDLPAGRFTLTATKSGYVTIQFGQTRPFESGKPIELADAQFLDKADITMPRGGVISGRIVDEFGEAVPDAMVQALRSTWVAGRRRLQNAGRGVVTNDLGQYRLFGLPPGEYYISATLRGGEFMMLEMMAPVANASPSASTPNSGYAPTYFPGTANGAEAEKVAVAAGQEVQSTDFALLAVRVAKIIGNVVSSEGKPVEGAMITAMPRGTDVAGGVFMPHSTRTDRHGNFTLAGVTPGDYVLHTRSMQVMTSGDGERMAVTMRMGGFAGRGGDSEFGSVTVSVGGEDLSNVMIVTSKGTTATGRVVFEGGAPPQSFTSMRITAMPGEQAEPMMFGPGGPGVPVNEDATFELRGLAGTRVIRTMNPPQGWMLKAVRLHGTDVTDSGVDFKAGDAVSGLEIVLTSRPTEITGTVKAANGSVVKDYTVVIFGDDPQKWTAPMSRYVTGTRPDQEGRFRARQLPPGDYYAIAFDYIEQGTWGDPELLERFRPKAKRFSLGDAETKTLDLELTNSITR